MGRREKGEGGEGRGGEGWGHYACFCYVGEFWAWVLRFNSIMEMCLYIAKMMNGVASSFFFGLVVFEGQT